MIPVVFVTLAALTLSAAPPSQAGHPHQPAATMRPAVANPNELYSLRARRRMVAYLKLRLLELREEHLQRAAAAIERRLPLSVLLKGP